LIAVAGLGTIWLLGAGCGEEAPPPKPAPKVVQKKIQTSEETATVPKLAEKPKSEPGKTIAPVAVAPQPIQPPEGQKSAPAPPAEAKTPVAAPAPPTPRTAGKPAEISPATEPSKPPVAEASQARSAETAYQYVPGNRPDPFQPFFEEAKAAVPASECVGIPPGPLTEQEVPQFALVAVVSQGKETVAMLQDRTGKGYLVRVGTFLGKKCGKVSGIDSEGVTVEEPYVDILGQTKTRKVALGFKKTEGGRR